MTLPFTTSNHNAVRPSTLLLAILLAFLGDLTAQEPNHSAVSGIQERKAELAALGSELDLASGTRLLEIAERLIVLEPNGVEAGLIKIAQNLSRIWGQDFPYPEILALATDPNRPDGFRWFMVDLATAGRHPDPDDRTLIVSSLTTIITEKANSSSLRATTLKKAASVIQEGVVDPSLYSTQFLTLLVNREEDPIVRAASMTALRRCNDVRAIATMKAVLNAPGEYHPEMVRYAAVELAKFPGALTDHLLLPTLTQTNDPRVFGSAVYAASLVKSGEALKHALPVIVSRCEAFENPLPFLSARSAISKHPQVINQMLLSSNPAEVAAALAASRISPSREHLTSLYTLQKMSPNFSADQIHTLNSTIHFLESSSLSGISAARESMRKQRQNID